MSWEFIEQCSAFLRHIDPILICCSFVVFSAGVSDDGEDEHTGIAEGGWREEKASSKTQLNKDMEKESGEYV